jgi:hypothetical protein
MNLLNASATTQEITGVFSALNIEFTESDGFMEMWEGDRFITKIVADNAHAISIANDMITARNDAAAERKETAQKLAEMTKDFTFAAIIGLSGDVIGLCKTDAKTVQLANIESGSAINVIERKVSRSKANLKKAEQQDIYGSILIDGRFYYSV